MQAVAVVRMVFLPRHDIYISTPTGELPRLLMKLFQLDRIFTDLYNTVFPALVKLTVVAAVVSQVKHIDKMVDFFVVQIQVLLRFGATVLYGD